MKKRKLIYALGICLALALGLGTIPVKGGSPLFGWSPDPVKEGDEVSFSTSMGYSSYSWWISDGPGNLCVTTVSADSTSATFTYTFDETGDWEVCLRVNEGLEGDTTGSQKVSVANFPPVIDEPTMWTGIPEPSEVDVPFHVVVGFTDYEADGYTCSIDYGDNTDAQAGTFTLSGDVKTCVGPNHSYTNPGEFYVTATITDIPDSFSISNAYPHAVCSQEITVTSNADDGSAGTLRQAIEDVCSGGVIAIDSSLSTTPIALQSPLYISKDLEIDGPATDPYVTIDGKSAGGSAIVVNSGVTASLYSLKIEHGNTTGNGGGIYNQGNLTVNDVTLSNNLASGNGGGIYNNGGTLTVTDSTFTKNSAGSTKLGGGIESIAGTLTISNSAFDQNTAQTGGGIYIDNGSATINDSTIGPMNVVTWAGGGMANSGGTVTLNRTTVYGNHGTGLIGGAGIWLTNAGSTTIKNSTISGNVTNNDGGGIFVDGGSLNLVHSTVTNNTANFDHADAPFGSVGGIFNNGKATIQNSIIAGNKDLSTDDTPKPDVQGIFTSLGGNLIGIDTDSSGWVASDQHGNATTPIDALLGDLLPNAPGATDTHALLSGSPAIDKVTCAIGITTDQRGVNRPQGLKCDIGAYELKGPITVNSNLQQSSETTGLCTLGAAIQAANQDKVVDGCSAGFGEDTIILPEDTYDLTAIVDSYHSGDVGLPPIQFGNLTIQGELVDGVPASIINRPATATAEFRLLTVLDVTLNLENVKLSGGKASVASYEIGGAILGSGEAIINLSHTTFTGNQAGHAGAVFSGAALNIADSTFENNTAGSAGGAIEDISDQLTITRSTFNNNSSLGSSGNGGAINGGCFDISDSTFSGNQSAFGGAIYTGGSCDKTITGSTFVNNNASGYFGGAIMNASGTLTITNSTFTGNDADYGGGIFNEYANLALKNVTMSANGATSNFGGNLDISITTSPNTVTITNSILANPISSSNCNVSTNDNPLVDGGGNLLTSACGLITSKIGNPVLQALGNNGGSTQTMALGTGSRALEIGVVASCPEKDQRGVTRPQPAATKCDAGAYESELLPPPADTTPPVVTVPDNMTVEATSSSGAVATFTTTANDNVDGTLTPTCDPASGSTFALGTTTVTCSATDSSGNLGSNHFDVTVVDTNPPTVYVPDDMTVPATSASGAIVTFSVTAYDLVDGNRTPACDPLSGSLFPGGTTTVTCTATDAAGNIGSSSFTVTVKTLHVSAITLTSKAGRTTFSFTGSVTINDYLGAVLNKAVVTVQWSRVGGDPLPEPRTSPMSSTNRYGIAKFSLRNMPAGTYKMCVTSVVKSGWVTMPNPFVETCEQVTVGVP